jgi:hypothetical protein
LWSSTPYLKAVDQHYIMRVNENDLVSVSPDAGPHFVICVDKSAATE